MRNPDLHFSALKHIAESPAHYLSRLTTAHEQTPAMRFGTLVHTLVLGGDPIAIYEGERRGKAWDSFADENAARMIVTRSEYARAEAVAESVLRDPVVNSRRLLDGDHERAWHTALYGRPCSGRIDVSGPGITVDLKTSATTRPDRFVRQCFAFQYHAQLAWYSAARMALGEDPGECFIIGVESKAPYAVTVLRMSARAIDEGRKLCSLWTERLRVCEDANEWPAYTQSIMDADIERDDELTFADDESEAA